MYRQEAKEEYSQALRLGQKEYKAAMASGKNPYPMVLEQMVENTDAVQDIGLVEIPAERIVGVKSAGRITAFTGSFKPLLSLESEFGHKWVELCAAHLSEGIRDPIVCYEYLGYFYVQEGNKRVSVLRHMGAPRITGLVKRVVPEYSEEPRIQAYYEFMEFYKATGLYQIQFRKPGDYGLFLSYLGKSLEESWTDREKRTVSAYFQYFREAFFAAGGERLELMPEEALLLWLEVYPFRDLGKLTADELKKSVAGLWEDIVALAQPEPVEVRTEPVATEGKPNMLTRLMTGVPGHVNVAFVYPMTVQTSTWAEAHDKGRQYLEQVLGEQVTTRSYFRADSPAEAEALMEQAVAEGADVVFTTTPQLSRSTLRLAVKYPKVRFLNCSVDAHYSSLRTYYGRIYEAKFITGAIAGAMANNDAIGYIGSNPIFGVPASINAFALGAQLTNPRAKIQLRWSCMAGTPQTDFIRQGMQVISNRDVPTSGRMHQHFCNYGTYAFDEDGDLIPLASPVWVWGKFYEKVIRSILAGTYDKEKDTLRAVNYWWGMDSGVIDIEFADHIPEGVKTLAQILRAGIRSGAIDPFRRRIMDQNGNLINDGSRTLTPDELLHMDWLCDNVVGSIPEFDQIEPYAQPMVRELGIYRDRIPAEMEGSL